MADRAGLENRCGGNITEGSNPSLSACIALKLRSCWGRVVLADILCSAPDRNREVDSRLDFAPTF